MLVVWLFAFNAQAQSKLPVHPEHLLCAFAAHLDSNIVVSNDTAYRFRISENNKTTSNFQRSLNCISTLYLRQNVTTRRKGIVMRYVPNMFPLERGKHSYLSEVQMRVQHHASGTTDSKVLAYHSTMPYQRAERFANIGRLNFMIYGQNLFFDDILNPLHQRNKRFYRYEYLFSLSATSQFPALHCIRITPRFSNEQLVSGIVKINKETGAVMNLKLTFPRQFQTINIEARMGVEGYNLLVPQRMRIVSNYKLLGNHVNEAIDVVAHHAFSHLLPSSNKRSDKLDFTPFCQLRLDTTQVINSVAHFDSIRPIPLHRYEKQLLKSSVPQQYSLSFFTEDTLQLSLPTEATEYWKNQTSSKHILNDRTQDFLLSSHAFNLTNNGRAQIKLPPIFTPSMMQWSGTRGLSLKIRLMLSIATTNNNDATFTFNPMVGYSFKQRQVYWDTPFRWLVLPKINGCLSFTAGGGSHSYNNEQAEELNDKFNNVESFDSLLSIINHYGFHDYRDTHVNADFAFSPLSGLTVTLGSRYHRRTLIEWNSVAQETGLIHRLTTFGPSIEVQWTPAQYYYKQGQRRIPLFSHYPTMLFKYERGYALGAGQTSYERIETDLHYRLPLYALRSLYFRVGGGMFTRRRKQCFLDYDYFSFSYMPQGWNDEFMGEFQLLNARFYNESRYYLRLTSSYESPMLMLSRLPKLSRLIQNERLYLNLLSVRSLSVYGEVGYSLSTHFFDFGSFLSFVPDRSCSVGCKVVFRLFDD